MSDVTYDDVRGRPSYPEDALLTDTAGLTLDDEKSAMAREGSFVRAHSPNELMCQVDNVSSLVVGIGHTHDFDTCMDYRHANVIGDQDPWTFWEEYDDWAQKQPTPPLPPPEPPLPEDWFPIARINPIGISQMDNLGTASAVTFAVYIEPSKIVLPPNPPPPGSTMRVKLSGPMTFSDCYIGDVDPTNPGAPWVSLTNVNLTFNGGANQATISVMQSPTFDPYGELASDPIPIDSIDVTNGIIVSFYIIGGNVGRRMIEPGWITFNSLGNNSSDLDKSDPGTWDASGGNVIGVLMVEYFFTPEDLDIIP
jgi:hypothetical protein